MKCDRLIMGLVIKCLVLIHFHQSCGGLDLEGADIFIIQCPSHDLPLAEKCNVLCLSVQNPSITHVMSCFLCTTFK